MFTLSVHGERRTTCLGLAKPFPHKVLAIGPAADISQRHDVQAGEAFLRRLVNQVAKQAEIVIQRDPLVARMLLDAGRLVGQQPGPRIVEVDNTIEPEANLVLAGFFYRQATWH